MSLDLEKLFTILLFSLLGVSLTAQSFPTLDEQVASGRNGLYLSISGGIKNSNAKNYESGYITYKGVGPIFDLKLGTSLSPHWVIHMTYLKNHIATAKMEIDVYKDITNDDITIDDNTIGVGATYYTNNNWFMSFSGGLNTVKVGNDDIGYKNTSNMGYQLKIGKEWYVSKRLAINFAGASYPYMARLKILKVNYGITLGLTFHQKQQM